MKLFLAAIQEFPKRRDRLDLVIDPLLVTSDSLFYNFTLFRQDIQFAEIFYQLRGGLVGGLPILPCPNTG